MTDGMILIKLTAVYGNENDVAINGDSDNDNDSKNDRTTLLSLLLLLLMMTVVTRYKLTSSTTSAKDFDMFCDCALSKSSATGSTVSVRSAGQDGI